MLTTNPSVLIYLHSESIDMRKSFDGPDEILGGYQGHVMADCYSRNMSVVAPKNGIGRCALTSVEPLSPMAPSDAQAAASYGCSTVLSY